MPTLNEINEAVALYMRLAAQNDSLAKVIKRDLEMRLTTVVSGSIHENRVESVVDIAMRLGYAIDKNFDGALGAYVKKTCEDHIVGTRITKADVSGKRVVTNMYAFKDDVVEEAVRCYCEQKSFDHYPVNVFVDNNLPL